MRTALPGFAAACLAVPAGAQELVYAFEGDSTGDRLGSAVAGVGDLSGDGHPDLLVGSFGDDIRQVRAFSGADGSFLFALNGLAPGDQFGRYLDGVGDLDLDGFGDFAVTAPAADYTRVYSGQTRAVMFHWDVPSWRVTGGGDVNGDGTADVVVGSGNPNSEARALSGLDGSLIHLWSGPWSFGSTVAIVGDVDADGYDDVAVSSVVETGTAGFEAGRVRVFSGRDGSLIHLLEGIDEYHWFGAEVAGAGDVDADGHDDVIVLAEIEHLFSWDAPYVRVFSGLDASVLHHFTYPNCYGLRGALRGAGDVDGDGRDDFFVGGETGCDGDEFLTLYSGLDGSPIYTISSYPSSGSLDLAGDVDGDGIDDFVLGREYDSPNGTYSGRAEVRRVLCALPPASYCVGAPNSAGPGASIGWSGPQSVGANQAALTADGCPAAAFGVFYYGPQQIQVPFGDGFRCVGGGGTGTFRLNPPIQTDGNGSVVRALDFDQPPMDAGPGAVQAGDTWNFQYWYRDVPAGLSGFNLTDGIAVAFCP